MAMNRRRFVAAASTTATWGSLQWSGMVVRREPFVKETAPAGSTTIGAAGASRGILAGAGVLVKHLRDAPDYAALVKEQLGILVEQNGFKFKALQPSPTEYFFEDADYVVNFAESNNIEARATALVWHAALPKWFDGYMTPQNAEQVMVDHIEKVCGRYAGRIQSWDVVNEALKLDDGMPGGFRNSPWYKLLGPGYIDIAFRAARRADPKTMLVYNDHSIENNTEPADKKRAALLTMVRGMQQRNVPIDAIGIQSHIFVGAHHEYGKGALSLIEQAREMGLKVLITEMTVGDQELVAPIPERDAAAAEVYTRYLDTVLSNPATCAVLTWGLTDRYSISQDKEHPRPDGTPQRPLPFDVDLKPKPAFFAEVKALQSAPSRS
jgi:endo-1,4-beta-xylanase